MSILYEFSVQTIDGEELSLDSYRGQVVLVVNVASKCGLTPQYAGLEALYRAYKDQGLVILGLPCNQFMNQEPGDEATIKSFCQSKYDVTFPLTSKIEVNGDQQHPLYAWLTSDGGGYPGPIKWNFEKFLIGRSGSVRGRYAPTTQPDDSALRADIEAALAESQAL